MELGGFTARQIASEADCSSLQEYESEVSHYQEQKFTYIPMPEDERYYHVEKEEVYEIEADQYIEPNTPMLAAFSNFEEYDFLLIDWFNNLVTGETAIYIEDRLDGADASELAKDVLEDPDRVREQYRDNDVIEDFISAIESTKHVRYSILTLADVNKRRARELFFRALSEFEVLLSRLVEDEFSESTTLFHDASAEAIGHWEKSKLDDLVVHISEHMYLTTLMKIVGKSEELRGKFGYESRNQFDDDLGSLIPLRNRVMHPTKTLVHNTEDLSKNIAILHRVIDAVKQFHRDEKESEFPVPGNVKEPKYSD
jgi:hypothetical protein